MIILTVWATGYDAALTEIANHWDLSFPGCLFLRFNISAVVVLKAAVTRKMAFSIFHSSKELIKLL